MDINGIWYNELGSSMEIRFVDGILVGTYQTKVGDATGIFRLVGLMDINSDNNIVIGWTVVWSNEYGNSKSLTSWSGEIQLVDEQVVIVATWLLTNETNSYDNWKSTLIGKDIFTKIKVEEEPLKTSLVAKVSSHPSRK